MKKELRGAAVLVTGASSGIGWATALAFAERGAKVALAARRTEKLAELAARVRAKGVEALEIPCDVSRREDAKKAVRAVAQTWGGLDVLVNNAGMNEYRRFEDLSLDEAEAIVRTNLLGPIYLIHEALPELKKCGGHVVNVSSVAGLRGMPFMAVYSATKFGLNGLTESLRVELKRNGVTLTAFCPGSVDTPMMDKAFVDPKLGRLAARMAKSPEGVARKIVRAAERRRPEVVYGEAPGFLIKAAAMFPCLADWVIGRGTDILEGRRLVNLQPKREPQRTQP